MFCYYLLGGDTAVLSGLYARFCHAFLVSLLFSGRPRSNEFSGTTGRNFTNLSEIRRADKFCIHLAIAQGTLPEQPTKLGKSAFFAEKFSLSHCHSEADWNIGTAMGSLEECG